MEIKINEENGGYVAEFNGRLDTPAAWLIIKYILIGLVERPRSISGEEVPRFFCGENLEGTKRFHR